MPRESAGRPLHESTPLADHESGAHKVARERRAPSSSDDDDLEALFAELAADFETTPVSRGADSDDLEADLPGVGDEFDLDAVSKRIKGINEQIARVKANESRVGAKVKQREEARLARKGGAEPVPSPSADLELADEAIQEISQKMAKSRTDKKAYNEERAKVKARGEKVASANFAKMKKDFPLGRRYDVAIGAPERVGRLPVQRLDESVLEDWQEPIVKSRRAIPEIPKLKTVSRPEAPKKSSVPELPAFVKGDYAKNRMKVAAEAPRVLIKDRAAIGAPERVGRLPVQRLDQSVLEDWEEPVVDDGAMVEAPTTPKVNEKPAIAAKSSSIFSRVASWLKGK